MTNPWNQAEFTSVRNRLSAVLAAEHALRNDRIARGDEWVEAEVSAMLGAVNRERVTRGLPLLPRAAVERMDAMASGHCDYATKFALYCSELAVGAEDVKP